MGERGRHAGSNYRCAAFLMPAQIHAGIERFYGGIKNQYFFASAANNTLSLDMVLPC